ncbi:hypothetical protein BO71DRAFT_482503 [Aspergillus ellipticus CBS 707.79]|uniref:HNH nuclease domain-containing protein n=1 Tax=Aspergillus ellipticus CBS 707.79 TaxID=1448320 RepID=A0A319DF08_9EURO|nr:hypothetical protein BO71DRAFT_482503 [Aspergillus ellipticus CBS 707.79]
MGPADELLDPRRRDLITRLSHITEESTTDSIGWACLWFADLSILEGLVETVGQNSLSVYITSLVKSSLAKNDKRTQAIRAWAVRARGTAQSSEDSGEPSEDEETDTQLTPTKKRRLTSNLRKTSKIPRWTGKQTAGPHLEASPSVTASPTNKAISLSLVKSASRAKKLCKERDDHTCILTGYSVPVEIAHIFPRSLGRKGREGFNDFWTVLQSFWTPQQVETWKEKVLGPDGVEACSNLMCLVNIAHKLWEKALFALKPLSLSEDKKQLKIQFYWLPMNKYRLKMPVTTAPNPFPHNLPSNNDKYTTGLFNFTTGTTLCSGDILTFRTCDPVGHPLPSIELLSMQWILHRVLALSGAAYATDKEVFPDADDPFGRLTTLGVYGEDSDWNSEMGVEEGEEEDEEEENKEAEDSQGLLGGGSWEELVIEDPRPKAVGNAPLENIPIGQSQSGSKTPRLPRPQHVSHENEKEQLGKEKQASEESSPLVLRFRNTNTS